MRWESNHVNDTVVPFFTADIQFQPNTVIVPEALAVQALALMLRVKVPLVAPAFKQVKLVVLVADWVSRETAPSTIASVSDEALTVAASAMEKIGLPPRKVTFAVVVERVHVQANVGEKVITSPDTAVIS